MLKIAVLVSGGGTNLQPLSTALPMDVSRHRDQVVISNNPRQSTGESGESGIEAVCISPKQYADRELFNDALLEAVNVRGVDLVVLAGFMVVVPEKMIKATENRMINIHPSLIPSFCGTGYYGLHVHEAALKRGVKISGATVHFVDEGTDTGPIIMQKPVEVRPDDTPEVLQRRIMEQAEWQIMPKVIDLIAHDKVHVKDGRVFVEE